MRLPAFPFLSLKLAANTYYMERVLKAADAHVASPLYYSYCRYKPDEISVTENGFNVPGESDMTMDQILNDTKRIKFFKEYIENGVAAAVYDKVPF